ncbi:hypothetical protein [Microbacterium sp. bgisy207]|jgi:hypothetical protein|uniref:hypothetical protein n=1 Tax=Microbacterium sp. bgisy207 TaxID=3413800 RepID=UPI003EB89F80
MMLHRRPRSVFAALALVPALLLVGCAASDADPLSTPTDVALDVAADDSTDAEASTAPAAEAASTEGELIPVPDGMPDVPLYGCEEEVDASVSETEFDTQWVWEFVCRTPDPFWRTVDGIAASAGWTNTVDQRSGNEDFLTENVHYIADIGGVAGDVDLRAFGSADDLEVTYTVTLAKP